jgi:hypothetical protein
MTNSRWRVGGSAPQEGCRKSEMCNNHRGIMDISEYISGLFLFENFSAQYSFHSVSTEISQKPKWGNEELSSSQNYSF